uniref:Immunoglobulin V-set domain-containing protein n=1 Tax=Monodelphis domestica TaxID=13616 RepID=F6WDQ6_MONDO
MAWTPLYSLQRLWGETTWAVVTQEPSLTVIPGGNITMTCSSSTGAITTGNYPTLFQQKPGRSPKRLIYNSHVDSGVPALFSGSLLGDKAALTIKRAQPGDEAITVPCNYSGSRHSGDMGTVPQKPRPTKTKESLCPQADPSTITPPHA